MAALAGPYAIEGVHMPTWIIRFDEAGTCESPDTQKALLAKLAESPRPTHIVFMSHGWNSDFADAINQYQAFLKAFEQVTTGHPPRGDYRPMFVGVTWPSVWFPLDKGPRLAGSEMETAARDQVIRVVGEDLDNAAAKGRLSELASKDRLSMDEVRETVALMLPSLLTIDNQDVPALDGQLTLDEVIAAARQIQAVIQPAPTLAKPGTFNPSGTASADIAGFEWLDPRNLLRLASLYQMKDRAGHVGSAGVADLLRQLLETRLPIHLVGHSFGAKVILSALCAPATLARPAASVLLLQPAISYLSFARTVPGRAGSGGYVAAMKSDLVDRPVFCTYSRSDFPLHDVFHIALRRATDLGDARIAAEAGAPPSLYAALGGYGPRQAAEQLINPIQKPGTPYIITDGARIVGLDGSDSVDFPAPAAEDRIACHGCVANPYTAWALHQQMF